MVTEIRKMPVGMQDFEDLRTSGFLYVDKTQYIYKLITQGKPYFLGRPRRFGKSLFLSTLKAYFLGKKELFEGLAIAETETDWTKYPVIYIDFNKAGYTNVKTLHVVLDSILDDYEKEWGMETIADELSVRFDKIIKRGYEITGQKVVVLVDEYDKPLVNTMDKPELNAEIRDVLKGFYGVLKSADAHLRFVFLTGVTKFSKVSIFSDLNQLQDISLDERFSGVCGITQAELEANFAPEITALAKKSDTTYEATLAELRKRYNGYRFSEIAESVYNPFSLLNTFSSLTYRYYWFATGTPTFLVKALCEQNYEIRNLEDNIKMEANAVMDYRVENTNLIPLLYQTGYLTIKSYNPILNLHVLGFPNEEVKYGFWNELLPAFVLKPIASGDFSVVLFLEQLMNNDVEGFMISLKAFFAAIPYDAIKQEHRDEQYYQHVFYLLFKLMGQYVEAEVKSAEGRADAVVKTADSIYVFEFKMDENATAEQALQQINDKGYSIPYIADHRRLVKVGVEFSQSERGVKRWLVELDNINSNTIT